MRVVIARCTVDYDGRLTAHLPEAVRLLMVKADGCVAVHADGGAYKPLNWMNAPNTLSLDESTGDDATEMTIRCHNAFVSLVIVNVAYAKRPSTTWPVLCRFRGEWFLPSRVTYR